MESRLSWATVACFLLCTLQHCFVDAYSSRVFSPQHARHHTLRKGPAMPVNIHNFHNSRSSTHGFQSNSISHKSCISHGSNSILFQRNAITKTRTSTATSAVSVGSDSCGSDIKGWDLYGRVPYDDWLFSNWKLTDPNILRPSLAEAVSTCSFLYFLVF